MREKTTHIRIARETVADIDDLQKFCGAKTRAETVKRMTNMVKLKAVLVKEERRRFEGG